MLITIQTGKKDKTRLALFGKGKCGDAGAFLSDAPRDFTPEHGRYRGLPNNASLVLSFFPV
jgi:hypothetical protein